MVSIKTTTISVLILVGLVSPSWGHSIGQWYVGRDRPETSSANLLARYESNARAVEDAEAWLNARIWELRWKRVQGEDPWEPVEAEVIPSNNIPQQVASFYWGFSKPQVNDTCDGLVLNAYRGYGPGAADIADECQWELIQSRIEAGEGVITVDDFHPLVWVGVVAVVVSIMCVILPRGSSSHSSIQKVSTVTSSRGRTPSQAPPAKQVRSKSRKGKKVSPRTRRTAKHE